MIRPVLITIALVGIPISTLADLNSDIQLMGIASANAGLALVCEHEFGILPYVPSYWASEYWYAVLEETEARNKGMFNPNDVERIFNERYWSIDTYSTFEKRSYCYQLVDAALEANFPWQDLGLGEDPAAAWEEFKP